MPSIWSSLVELFGTITVQRLNSSWWKNIRYNIVVVTKFFSHAVHGNACYIENIDMHCHSATTFRLRAWPPQPSRVAPTAIGATDGNLLPYPRHVNSKI
jgi:hypothetical protein